VAKTSARRRLVPQFPPEHRFNIPLSDLAGLGARQRFGEIGCSGAVVNSLTLESPS
jgi:hypothetical protein